MSSWTWVGRSVTVATSTSKQTLKLKYINTFMKEQKICTYTFNSSIGSLKTLGELNSVFKKQTNTMVEKAVSESCSTSGSHLGL